MHATAAAAAVGWHLTGRFPASIPDKIPIWNLNLFVDLLKMFLEKHTIIPFKAGKRKSFLSIYQ